MMKKVFLSAVMLLFVVMASAQNPLGKGEKQINAGLGFSSWGLPIYVGLDFGVHPDISVGGELGYRAYHDNWAGTKYNHSIFSISGNGNYHFNKIMNIPSKWDLYAGLSLGFYIWSSSADYPGDNVSGLGLGAQVGARYFITDRFGLNLEFGGGNVVSGGKFGITYQF